MDNLSELTRLFDGSETSAVELFQKLVDNLFRLIVDAPPSLKTVVSTNVNGLLSSLSVKNEASMIMTVLVRIDRAMMSLTNKTVGSVPPNFHRLLRWYDEMGLATLSIWLQALQEETLHEFLVDNTLPYLLRDPREFFCGRDSTENLLKYFPHPELLPRIKNDLCDVHWVNLTREFREYFLENRAQHEFDLFEFAEIGYRVANYSVREAIEVVDVIAIWMGKILMFDNQRSSIET